MEAKDRDDHSEDKERILTAMLALEISIFVAAIFASAFFSGSETGLYCLNRIRLRARVEKGDRSARGLQYLLQDISKTIVAILIGNNIANYIGTALFTQFIARSNIGDPQIVATAILTPIVFIFGETLPKNVFQQKADVLMYRLHGILSALRVVFYPIIVILTGISRLNALLFRKHARQSEMIFTRQGLRYFFQESRGTITPYLGQITDNIMSLHSSIVADAMIALPQVVMVEVSTPSEEVEQIMRNVRFSRLPVYENRRDNIIGILNCFDYLYEEEHRENISHLVRSTARFNRTTPVHIALHRMQAARHLMAIITDDFGRAVGIVTLKDLVEEIVGELAETA